MLFWALLLIVLFVMLFRLVPEGLGSRHASQMTSLERDRL